MNENLDIATGLVDTQPAVDAPESSVASVLAATDGTPSVDGTDGDYEVVGYVQTGEDV